MSQPGRESAPRFTYGHYVHWPEGERWELIDGVPYDMTPAPSRLHQKIVAELVRQIGNALAEHPCELYPAPFDVRLPDTDEADDQVHTVVQPDISVICDQGKLDERGCRGAPDFIIEILSPSTAFHDETRKMELYERHGVREYWIVSPAEGRVAVRLLGPDGQFGPAEVVDATTVVQVTVLLGMRLDLRAVFSG